MRDKMDEETARRRKREREKKWRQNNRRRNRNLPRFKCAKCGGEFYVPRGTAAQHADERFVVRLGGQTVCEPCARARFRRRHIEWGIHPDAIR